MDTSELRQKIDLLNEQLVNFEHTQLSEIWQTRQQIFDLLKVTDFATKEERMAMRADLQILLDTLDFKQQKQKEENEKFALEADARIETFVIEVQEKLTIAELGKEDYASLKKITDEVFEFIRQSRWPSKERRTAAWEKFQASREAWKQREDEWYAQWREKMASLHSQSEVLHGKIVPLLKSCGPEAEVQQLIDEMKSCFAELQKESDTIKVEDWLQSLPEEAAKQSLKVKSGAISFIRRFLIARREDFTKDHRDGLFEMIDGLQKQSDEAWQQYREERKQKQAEWEEKRHDFEAKRQEWQRKQEDFLSMLQNRLRNKVEYREKIVNGPAENDVHIQKIEDRIGRQQDYLMRLQSDIEELQYQHDNAWSKSFKDKSGGWIEEKKQKMAAAQRDVDNLNKRLDSIKTSGQNTTDKVTLLDSEIAELQSKIEEVKIKLEKK